MLRILPVALFLGALVLMTACKPESRPKRGKVETLELFAAPAYSGAYPSGYSAESYIVGGACTQNTFVLKNGARVDAGTPAWSISYIQHGEGKETLMAPADRMWSDREYFVTFTYEAPEGVTFPETLSAANVAFNEDTLPPDARDLFPDDPEKSRPILESAKTVDGKFVVTFSFDWPYEPLGLNEVLITCAAPVPGTSVSAEAPAVTGYYPHYWSEHDAPDVIPVDVVLTDYYWLDQGLPATSFSHLDRQLYVSVELKDRNYYFSDVKPWNTNFYPDCRDRYTDCEVWLPYYTSGETVEILKMTDTTASLCITFHGVAHELIHEAPWAATCTGEGNIDYYLCVLCGEFFADEAATEPLTADEIRVNALGHKYVVSEKDSTEPTCTAPGRVIEVCERCGCARIARILPAVGHTETYTVNDMKTHRITCAVCGADLGLGWHEHPYEDCSLCGYFQVN